MYNLQEGRRETPCIPSTNEVGELYECFLLLSKYDLQTQSEMENIYVHTPSQRVQKLGQLYYTLISLNSCKFVM